MKNWRLYFELTKPRIMLMVLITTMIGFFLARGEITSWSLLLWTLLGTYFLGSGSSALNHYMERDIDAKMERTKNRPLPSALLTPAQALMFGINLILIGLVILYFQVNLMTAFLALLGAFLYNLVYTPMKRISWWNTFVGSIPGALPPLWGWTAVTGDIEVGGLVLFLILVVWQHPHFFAIAWMYKEDYARGDLKMLPVLEPDGESTFRQILLYCLLLIPISILPVAMGLMGQVYFWGALFIGCGFLASGVRLACVRDRGAARDVLKASVIYLPLLLILIVGDVLL